MHTPTNTTYSELDKAYNHFNRTLFQGKLPECLMTLQRKNYRVMGFFAHKRFEQQDQSETADEMAMNPSHFIKANIEDVLSTLVHEMVHLKQAHFGKPGRRGYHNKQWGAMMKEIGLYPSNTGKPGGKETGEQMSHYIMEEGPFHKACHDLLATGFTITWRERTSKTTSPGEAGEGGETLTPTTSSKKNSSLRHKYTCPKCSLNAWGKPNIKLMCGTCELPLIRR